MAYFAKKKKNNNNNIEKRKMSKKKPNLMFICLLNVLDAIESSVGINFQHIVEGRESSHFGQRFGRLKFGDHGWVCKNFSQCMPAKSKEEKATRKSEKEMWKRRQRLVSRGRVCEDKFCFVFDDCSKFFPLSIEHHELEELVFHEACRLLSTRKRKKEKKEKKALTWRSNNDRFHNIKVHILEDGLNNRFEESF
jgi:hypothetical protein